MSDQPRSHLDLASWHTGRLVSAAARLIEHTLDTGIAELGITHAGARVLAVLAEGPLTQRQLAVRCHVQDQTMSRTLDGLERSGLVKRHRDSGDRRRVLVERTDDGAHAMDYVNQVATTQLPLDDAADAEDVAACRRMLIVIIERYSVAR